MNPTGAHTTQHAQHAGSAFQPAHQVNGRSVNGATIEKPALVCADLVKQFGDVQAVDGLDLSVAEGDILALVGPSGCGKTTALRLIAGFDQLDGGTVTLHGQIVGKAGKGLPPEKRRVGMVFQEGALFPHMTVERNIAYGLPRSGQRKEKVDQVLELVGLTDLRHRMPYELSGGQQQRVALARALAPNPDILLLDEPFSNLDPKLREQVRRDVLEILRSSRITTVFVTHDQEEALFVGDVIAVVNQGKVEQFGPPEEIFHHPATRFVAQFIGMVDFLPAWQEDGHLMTEVGTVSRSAVVPLQIMQQSSHNENRVAPEPDSVAPETGQEVEVMVRPDCLDCFTYTSGADANGRANQPPGVVVEREFRGSFYLYRVALPSGNTVRCLLPHTADFAIGEEVGVALRHGHNLLPFSDQGPLVY